MVGSDGASHRALPLNIAPEFVYKLVKRQKIWLSSNPIKRMPLLSEGL